MACFYTHYNTSFTAVPSPSSPPTDFSIAVSMTSLVCTWSPPDEALQTVSITSYTLSCNTNNETVVDLTLKATVFEISIDLFSSATTYTCTVLASNSAGNGPSSTLNITTEGIQSPIHAGIWIGLSMKHPQVLLSVTFHSSLWVLNMALV